MMLKKLTTCAVLMLTVIILLSSCGTGASTPKTDTPTLPTDTTVDPSHTTTAPIIDTVVTTEAPSVDTASPGTNNTAEISPDTTYGTANDTEEVIAPASYDWSKPVPESTKKDISWFDDTLFIGDSRIGGFQMFAGVYNAEYITFPGMAVDKYFTWKFYPKNGAQLTAVEALNTIDKKYTKVYINLGLNELGWDPYFEPFHNKLCDVIDSVRAWNPDADIYLINVFPIGKDRQKSVSWETLENLDEVNSRIIRAASSKQVYYIDMDTVFRNAEGYLPDEYSNDGVHLNSGPIAIFRDYLLTHTVEEK